MQRVKDEGEMIAFKAGKCNIELYLRMAYQDGVIDYQTCWDLSRRVQRAKTSKELIKIVREIPEDMSYLFQTDGLRLEEDCYVARYNHDGKRKPDVVH